MELFGKLEIFISPLQPGTQRNIRLILREWISFCGGEDSAISATVETAYSFIDHQKRRRDGMPDAVTGDRSLCSKTIKNKITYLNRFYAYLSGLNYVDRNPFQSIAVQFKARAEDRKRQDPLIPFEKIQEIINLPSGDTKQGRRDRALLAILFAGGLRCSEALNLRILDYTRTLRDTPYVRLRKTKTGEGGNQVLNAKWAITPIEALIDQRYAEGAEPHDFLFVNYATRGHIPGRHLAYRTAYRIFKYWCERAGLVGYYPHAARHTSITKLLSDGLTHRQVQQFSRHKSIAMVEIYDRRVSEIELHPGKVLEFPSVKKFVG